MWSSKVPYINADALSLDLKLAFSRLKIQYEVFLEISLSLFFANFCRICIFMPNIWVDKKSACHNIYVLLYVRDSYSAL